MGDLSVYKSEARGESEETRSGLKGSSKVKSKKILKSGGCADRTNREEIMAFKWNFEHILPNLELVLVAWVVEGADRDFKNHMILLKNQLSIGRVPVKQVV